MQIIKALLKSFKKTRLPADSVTLLALTGAVVIHTEDGHNVVLTPRIARDIAEVIRDLATEAEKVLPIAE